VALGHRTDELEATKRLIAAVSHSWVQADILRACTQNVGGVVFTTPRACVFHAYLDACMNACACAVLRA